MNKLAVVHNANNNTIQVQLTYYDETSTSAPVEFKPPVTQEDRSDLRWYLEDYLRFPIGKSLRAQKVESRMTEVGKEIFEAIFSGREARDYYVLVRNKGFNFFDFEISYESANARNVPWELLYDPEFKCYLVNQFDSFARHQKTSGIQLLKRHQAQESLNILLVTARPGGSRDIPYRTVVRPMMEILEQPELRGRIHVEALRPPTFEHFVTTIKRTRENKSVPFFDVVHFDGHGEFGDVFTKGDNTSDVSEVSKAAQGKLLFENTEGEANPVDADKLGEFLGQQKVPLIVLNACRSGMEALKNPKKLGGIEEDKIKEKLAQQNEEIASVTSRLLTSGAQGVVGMGYNVYAKAIAVFMKSFYQNLLDGKTAAKAVSAGRLALLEQNKRPTRLGDFSLQDWIIPVYNRRRPVLLFKKPAPQNDIDSLMEAMLDGTDIEEKQRDYLPPPPQFGFLGRDREMLEIERILQQKKSAGANLTGSEGIGKTTLAIACTRWLQITHAERIRDGVFMHNFIAETSAGTNQHPNLSNLVLAVGLKRFGEKFLRLTAQQQLTLVTEFFKKGKCLLVLDNAEAATGWNKRPALLTKEEQKEFSDFLREITPSNGSTRLIVTSRRTAKWLGVPTQPVELGGLSKEAADELALSVLRGELGQALLDTKKSDGTWQSDYFNLLKTLDGHPSLIQSQLPYLKHRSPSEVEATQKKG